MLKQPQDRIGLTYVLLQLLNSGASGVSLAVQLLLKEAASLPLGIEFLLKTFEGSLSFLPLGRQFFRSPVQLELTIHKRPFDPGSGPKKFPAPPLRSGINPAPPSHPEEEDPEPREFWYPLTAAVARNGTRILARRFRSLCQRRSGQSQHVPEVRRERGRLRSQPIPEWSQPSLPIPVATRTHHAHDVPSCRVRTLPLRRQEACCPLCIIVSSGRIEPISEPR